MKTTKEVIKEQQAINRSLWAKENGVIHHADGNKLIAEFMGCTFYENTKHTIDQEGYEIALDEEGLKYHASWSWLMPVVQTIKDGGASVEEFVLLDKIDNVLTCDLQIELLYKAVVEFIKWYNENK